MSTWRNWAGTFEREVNHIVRPANLRQLIEQVRRVLGKSSPIHAEGSRWAFSSPAYCEGTIVSTDLLNKFPASVQDAINPSTDPTKLRVAVEGGIKVRNLYTALAGRDAARDPARDGVPVPDGARVFGARVPADIPISIRSILGLNKWVLPVLGGAGGQSISGAINTGTHGGDVARPPLSDSVLAMLVVGDFGRLILIQRPWGKNTGIETPIVNVTRLTNNLTRSLIPWWWRFFFRRRIEVEEINEENMLNAAVVSVGRFGVVYAYVLEAWDESGKAIVEGRERSTWEQISNVDPRTGQIPLFEQLNAGRERDGFLQVVINPYLNDSGEHVCFVTTHKIQPGNPIDPHEAPILDYVIDRRADRNGHGFMPLMQLFCVDHVTDQVRGLIDDLRGFANVAISEGVLGSLLLSAVPFLGPIASAAGIAAGAYVARILNAAADSLERISPSHLVGDVIADVLNRIRDDNIPMLSSKIIELVTTGMLEGEQKPWDAAEDWDEPGTIRTNVKGTRFEIADFFDYEHDCYRGDSVEIFFEGNADLPDKVSRLLTIFQGLRERNLQIGAYVSMRFMSKTQALLGMARFSTTCAIEVAMLRGIPGNQEALTLLQQFAVDNNGLIHWGQHNDRERIDVERQFSRSLDLWRDKLSHVASYFGRFYTPFTQSHGLYVLRSVDYTGWEDLGLTARNSPAMVSSGAGQPLQIFALDQSRKILTRQRDGSGSVSDWIQVAGEVASDASSPVVHRDPSGQIELFIRSSENRIKHCWQMSRPGGEFSDWDTKGFFNPGISQSDVSLVTHLDGRIELFMWGAPETPSGRRLLHCWQYWAGDHRIGQWSDVVEEGLSPIGSPPSPCFRRFGGTTDQIVVVALRGNDIVEKHHKGPGWLHGWTDWERIVPPSEPVVRAAGVGGPICFSSKVGEDHIVHILATDIEGEVHEIVEANRAMERFNWSTWRQLGTTSSFGGMDPNCRLFVLRINDQVLLFGRTRNREVLGSRFQLAVGWSDWTSFGAETYSDIAAGSLPDGMIDVVAKRASDSHLIVRRIDPSRL